MSCAGSCGSTGITPNGAQMEWTLVNGAVRPIIELEEDIFKYFRLVYVSIKRYDHTYPFARAARGILLWFI